MPWITNEDGKREYKVSIYAKEELPTWDEIYNEWYLNKQFIYNPDEELSKIEDLYWKIPHQMYLLITVCNQLNKMIYEDGIKDQVLQFLMKSKLINQNLMFKFSDIRFVIISQELHESPKCAKFLKDTCRVGTPDPPLIYSISMPDGKKNPFIINNLQRTYFYQDYDYHRKKAIGIFLDCTGSFDNPEGPILGFLPFDDEEGKYQFIIDYMMIPYRSYFENGIGWKDENGRLMISSRPVLGFDPAK